MSGFNDFDSSPDMGGRQPSKQEIMDEVRQQLAVANAQQLLQKMTDKCFNKCITKPGSDLSGSDRACLAKCMDRYLESWNVISKAYATRVQKDAEKGGMH
eukprot:CFRG3873T1